MKILLVTGRSPWPPRRGDQLRSLQILEALVPRHEVTLLAPASGHLETTLPGRGFRRHSYRPEGRLATMGSVATCLSRGLPAQCGLFLHAELSAQLRHLAPRHDLVILQLARLAAQVDNLMGAPLVVDLVDALSLSFRTRAAIESRALRPIFEMEARRLENAERLLLEACRRALLVSERDREWLGQRLPELASRLEVVPLAIEPTPPPPPPPPGQPPTVALTGNLGYFANEDAVRWWLSHVWAELKARRPDLQLRIAGDRPPRALRRLVARAGAVLEAQPRDLRSVLSRARVAVAPLRCGAGTPVKILEAWAAEVPVVASASAAEGAGARDGEELLVASEPEQWVTQVERLLEDSQLRHHLTSRAARRLATRHHPETVRKALEEALREAMAGTGWASVQDETGIRQEA